MTTQKVVLFDLDDNFHDAEMHLFLPGLRHLFRAAGAGFEWRPNADGADNSFTPITPDQEPGVGVMPRLSILHLIRALKLLPESFNEDGMKKQGFSESTVQNIIQLMQEKQADEIMQEKLATVLENERVEYFLRRINEEGIISLPGYEVVQRLKEAGYKVGIVTSAPQRVAMAVLEKLGMVTYGSEEEYQNHKGETKTRRRKTDSYVDAVVGGNMAEAPKPSAAPLRMADWVIRWNSLSPEERTEYRNRIRVEQESMKDEEGHLDTDQRRDLLHFSQELIVGEGMPRALFHGGDSGSDVGAAIAYDIPVIVRVGEFTDVEKMRQRGATIFVDTYDEITPALLEKPPEQWEAALELQRQQFQGGNPERN